MIGLDIKILEGVLSEVDDEHAAHDGEEALDRIDTELEQLLAERERLRKTNANLVHALEAIEEYWTTPLEELESGPDGFRERLIHHLVHSSLEEGRAS